MRIVPGIIIVNSITAKNGLLILNLIFANANAASAPKNSEPIVGTSEVIIVLRKPVRSHGIPVS